jgi:hypothetical protein
MSYTTYSDEVKLVCTIPVCGCGTPDECYKWLIEYLTDLDKHSWDKYSYDDDNWKLIQLINGMLEEKGFVEHGCTCRCSWLTDSGKKLLRILKYMQKYNFDFNPDEDTEYGKWFWVEKDD